jgi:hypothetical protein
VLWEKAIVGLPLGASVGLYPDLVAITAMAFVLIEYIRVPIPIVLLIAGAASYLSSSD